MSYVSIRTHLALPHYVPIKSNVWSLWVLDMVSGLFFFFMLACQKWKFNNSCEIGGLRVMFVWATSEGFFSYGG